MDLLKYICLICMVSAFSGCHKLNKSHDSCGQYIYRQDSYVFSLSVPDNVSGASHILHWEVVLAEEHHNL